MPTRAAKVAAIQAKAAAAAARKRKVAQMELDGANYIKQFDKTAAAIMARRERDEETKNMIIRGDPSWRKGKKGQAIAGSEDGLYPDDAIVKDDCVGEARDKVQAWLQTKPEFSGFVPYVPNGKLVWRKMAGHDVCAFEALLCASLFDEGAL